MSLGASDHSSDHHVHFDTSTKDEFSTEKCVTTEQIGPGVLAVHLGFLQINHRYLITFSMPTNICDTVKLDPVVPEVPNLNCTLVEFNKDEKSGRYMLKVEFIAHKEKLLKEELAFMDVGNGSKIRLVFNARVLGKGKGTPMLRNGIRCLGVTDDDEGEQTDWPGFDSPNPNEEAEK